MEVFTKQTFFDVYISVIILGIQIANTFYYIHSSLHFQATPSELSDPDI